MPTSTFFNRLRFALGMFLLAAVFIPMAVLSPVTWVITGRTGVTLWFRAAEAVGRWL
jgi:hypothetical protein